MTPTFKTFLAIVISMSIFVFILNEANASEVKFCMAEVNKKTGEVGCWTGTKTMLPAAWLKKISPSSTLEKVEIVKDIKGKPVFIRVYFK